MDQKKSLEQLVALSVLQLHVLQEIKSLLVSQGGGSVSPSHVASTSSWAGGQTSNILRVFEEESGKHP